MRIEYSEWFLDALFVNKITNWKYLFIIDPNIWIDYWFEFLIGFLFVDNKWNWKYLLRRKYHIWKESFSKFFFYVLLLVNIINWISFLWIDQKFWKESFLYIIHISSIDRSWSKRKILSGIWVEYLNKSFIWISHWSCGYQ
jgi:hypothetical protein